MTGIDFNRTNKLSTCIIITNTTNMIVMVGLVSTVRIENIFLFRKLFIFSKVLDKTRKTKDKELSILLRSRTEIQVRQSMRNRKHWIGAFS